MTESTCCINIFIGIQVFIVVPIVNRIFVTPLAQETNFLNIRFVFVIQTEFFNQFIERFVFVLFIWRMVSNIGIRF